MYSVKTTFENRMLNQKRRTELRRNSYIMVTSKGTDYGVNTDAEGDKNKE